MLDAFPRWTGAEEQADLNPRDTLVLHSDGVTGAGIDRGEEFGEERLIRTVRANQRQPAGALVESVVAAVSSFSGASRFDDVTVVVIRAL